MNSSDPGSGPGRLPPETGGPSLPQGTDAGLSPSDPTPRHYASRGRLRFVPDLERRYQRYRQLRDGRYVRQLINLLIAFYILFGAFDWLLLQQQVERVLVIRYGLGLPGMLGLWLVLHTGRRLLPVERVVFFSLFWLSFTTLLMIRVVPEAFTGPYLLGVLVIVMAGITVGRMGFWVSLSFGVLFLLSFLAVLGPVLLDNAFWLYYLFLSCGAIVLCLLAQFTTDRSGRREFLQKLMIHRKNHELRKLNSRLRDLAEVDALTGIANRRSFDQVLEEEWRRAQRRGYSLALLMGDIDFFKAYNDALGHQQGDICIRQVAQSIKASVRRPGDMVARYGGEEFAVILPALQLSEAATVARMVCDQVRTLRLPHPASPVYPFVTISVGVAAMVPQEQHSPAQLVGAADEALYQAKRAGRNGIHLGVTPAAPDTEGSDGR